MKHREVRLAVIGAGAVAEKRYLPVAASVDGATVTHVVDLDLGRARRLAEEHGVPGAAASFEEVLDEVDAAVVATPPATHREIATGCLERNVHVLCEKPLAPGPEDAEAIARVAGRSEAMLSVGMVWRLSRSAQLLRRCVELGLPGKIHRVVAEHGGEFSWPVKSGHLLDPEQGGVLRDTGVHVLDLLFWALEVGDAHVKGYEDDSWGGAEANARIELELEVGEGEVPAEIEVSFTRALENRIVIWGSAGRLEVETLGGGKAIFRPEGQAERIRLVEGDGSSRSRDEDFALQLRTFVSAIREGRPPPVPAASTLLPLRVIRDCRAMRRFRVRPWEAPPGEREAFQRRATSSRG